MSPCGADRRQVSPDAGARVAPLSLREMRGIYLARGAIQGVAARVAAQTITAAEPKAQLDPDLIDLTDDHPSGVTR